MKKIACVGYHYTGSGVIDDIFRECDNVFQGTYEAEIRMLHDPDGISDLEFHLVENPHRLSSGLAIKRFIAYAKRNARQYKKVVGEAWPSIAIQYAEDLALIKYHGYVGGDMLFFTRWQRIVVLSKRIWRKLLPAKLRGSQDANMIHSVITYYSRLDEKAFLEKTLKFVDGVCAKANKVDKEFIVLDQFIGANNPTRYLRYVDNIKVIIVDRDPRDVYISRISADDRVLPKDPYEFCLYFKSIRIQNNVLKNSNCLYIRFEDLIYDYEASIKKVLNFVGISKEHHINALNYFNPEVSMKNTRLWINNERYVEAVKIIEEQLPEYLYCYDD